MATYTEKLGLKMPAQTDFYNVDDFNENFRKIDESMAMDADIKRDIQQVLTLADPIRSNRAPTTADAQFAGKLWVVPKMIFNNMMPNALAQAAGNWRATAATVSTSGTAATLVGDGTASTIVGEVDMTAVKANDIVYIAAKMAVTTDANGAVLELLCGGEVIATASMSVPVAGDNIRLIGHTKVDAAGALKLRVTTMYNSASAQLGKGVTVSDITILDLTADMCQNFAGIEFSEDEITTYIDTYGNFQTKIYELSEYWWICRGSYNGQYSWQYFNQYVNELDADLQGQIDEQARVYANMFAKGLGYKKVTIKCVDQSGTEYFGIPVKLDATGLTYLNSYGRLVFYVNTQDYIYLNKSTITVIVPIDMTSAGAVTFELDLTNTEDAEFVFICTPKDTVFTLNTSVDAIMFSSRVLQAIIWMCGGGGSGGVGRSNNNQQYRISASGGAGGYTAQKTLDIIPGVNLGSLEIGAGGAAKTGSWSGTSAGASAGNDGGASKLVAPDGSITMQADGGKGGTVRSATSNGALTGAAGGSGAGGIWCSTSNANSAIGNGGSNGSNGSNGSATEGTGTGGKGQGTTTYPFGDTSLPLCCSAGGGALAYNLNAYTTGNAGSGASKGVTGNTEGSTPTSASPTTPGSGSGAAVGYYNGSGSGGTKTAAGANGICYIKLILKTA